MINFIYQCRSSYIKDYYAIFSSTNKSKRKNFSMSSLFLNDHVSSKVVSYCSAMDILQLERTSKRLNHIVKVEKQFKFRRKNDGPGIHLLVAKEFVKLCFPDLTEAFVNSVRNPEEDEKEQQDAVQHAVQAMPKTVTIFVGNAFNTFSFEELNKLSELYRTHQVKFLAKINKAFDESTNTIQQEIVEKSENLLHLIGERMILLSMNQIPEMGEDQIEVDNPNEICYSELQPLNFEDNNIKIHDVISRFLKVIMLQKMLKDHTIYLNKKETRQLSMITSQSCDGGEQHLIDKILKSLTEIEIGFINKETLLFNKILNFLCDSEDGIREIIVKPPVEEDI